MLFCVVVVVAVFLGGGEDMMMKACIKYITIKAGFCLSSWQKQAIIYLSYTCKVINKIEIAEPGRGSYVDITSTSLSGPQ